jgi:hypothetical protein
VPKVRSKARYSLVLINEAGASRQIELTPLRLRIAAIALVGALGVTSVLAGLGVRGIVSGSPTSVKQDTALVEKVRGLQEDLNKKELALAVQEKRLKEMQETPTLAMTPPRPGLEAPSSKGSPAGKDGAASGQGPLMALQEPDDAEGQAPAGTAASEEEFEDLQSPPPAEPKSGQSKALSSAEQTPAAPAGDEAKFPPINFNAQAVTATTDGANHGILSFRLVKDQPDIPFSGYLFVFVELADPRGKSTAVVYPGRTRVGDGDLPSNYKDGKSLGFKYNSRIELPYDVRSGAHLEKVSILLYGENGKIVFQRGFDRAEVKMLSAKGSGVDGARTRAGDKRRAL